MLVFRILHIVAGVAWVGALTLLVLYLQPSARAIGPAAGPFMQELVGRRRLTNFLAGIGGVTVLAGLFLYWHDWDASGSLGDWLGTRFGAVMTVGAIAAIIGLIVGVLGARPATDRLVALGARIASAGRPPTAEEVAEVQALQARARRLAIVVLTLLVISTLAMAIARYW